MLLTAAVYPLSCFGIGFVLNTIAIFQRSLAAVPFGTMVVRRFPICSTPIKPCSTLSLSPYLHMLKGVRRLMEECQTLCQHIGFGYRRNDDSTSFTVHPRH